VKLPLQILDSAGVNPQNPVSKGVTARFRCFGGFLDRILVWQPLLRLLAREGFPRLQVNSIHRMHHEALIICKWAGMGHWSFWSGSRIHVPSWVQRKVAASAYASSGTAVAWISHRRCGKPRKSRCCKAAGGREAPKTADRAPQRAQIARRGPRPTIFRDL
jgi:hypothetical protein